MNPIGLILRLFNIIGLGDVDREFFRGRTLVRHAIYGPGTLLIMDRTTMSNCRFISCDFIEVRAGIEFQAAMPIEDTVLKNTAIHNATILCTKPVIRKLKESIIHGSIHEIEGEMTSVPAIS